MLSLSLHDDEEKLVSANGMLLMACMFVLTNFFLTNMKKQNSMYRRRSFLRIFFVGIGNRVVRQRRG
jgi:hypothetical protein